MTTIDVLDDGEFLFFDDGEILAVLNGNFEDHFTSFFGKLFGPYSASDGDTVFVNALIAEHEYCFPFKPAIVSFNVADIDGGDISDPNERDFDFESLLDRQNVRQAASGKYQVANDKIRVNYIVEHKRVPTPYCVRQLFRLIFPFFLKITPAVFVLEPGSSVESSFMIRNPTSEPVEIRVSVTSPDLYVEGPSEGKVADLKPVQSDWFDSTQFQQPFVLGPNADVENVLRITLPEQVEQGTYAYELRLWVGDQVTSTKSAYFEVASPAPQVLDIPLEISPGEAILFDWSLKLRLWLTLGVVLMLVILILVVTCLRRKRLD